MKRGISMIAKKKYLATAIIIVLLTLVCGGLKNLRFGDVDPEVKKIVYSSLDLQYNRFSRVNPDTVIDEKVLKKDMTYYQYSKWPCVVLDMQESEVNGEKCVYVTLKDREGEYIQEIKLIKKNGDYMIKDISYDI